MLAYFRLHNYVVHFTLLLELPIADPTSSLKNEFRGLGQS